MPSLANGPLLVQQQSGSSTLLPRLGLVSPCSQTAQRPHKEELDSEDELLLEQCGGVPSWDTIVPREKTPAAVSQQAKPLDSSGSRAFKRINSMPTTVRQSPTGANALRAPALPLIHEGASPALPPLQSRPSNDATHTLSKRGSEPGWGALGASTAETTMTRDEFDEEVLRVLQPRTSKLFRKNRWSCDGSGDATAQNPSTLRRTGATAKGPVAADHARMARRRVTHDGGSGLPAPSFLSQLPERLSNNGATPPVLSPMPDRFSNSGTLTSRLSSDVAKPPPSPIPRHSGTSDNGAGAMPPWGSDRPRTSNNGLPQVLQPLEHPSLDPHTGPPATNSGADLHGEIKMPGVQPKPPPTQAPPKLSPLNKVASMRAFVRSSSRAARSASEDGAGGIGADDSENSGWTGVTHGDAQEVDGPAQHESGRNTAMRIFMSMVV